MDSFFIKFCLISYFKFRRNWLACDEIFTMGHEIADILVNTGKEIREIEIKVSKSDLWNGEKRKNKHKPEYINSQSSGRANKFYICVPEELKEEAIKWVDSIDKRYGILICANKEYLKYGQYSDLITTYKQAKSLHTNYSSHWNQKFLNRFCNISFKYYDSLILARSSKCQVS